MRHEPLSPKEQEIEDAMGREEHKAVIDPLAAVEYNLTVIQDQLTNARNALAVARGNQS